MLNQTKGLPHHQYENKNMNILQCCPTSRKWLTPSRSRMPFKCKSLYKDCPDLSWQESESAETYLGYPWIFMDIPFSGWVWIDMDTHGLWKEETLHRGADTLTSSRHSRKVWSWVSKDVCSPKENTVEDQNCSIEPTNSSEWKILRNGYFTRKISFKSRISHCHVWSSKDIILVDFLDSGPFMTAHVPVAWAKWDSVRRYPWKVDI